MKNFIWFFALFFSLVNGQTLSKQTLLKDKISIRAIEIVDNKVWYVGTDSKFGFVDLKNPQNAKQIRLSDKAQQFRTLGYANGKFHAINIESPAQFYTVDKKTLEVKTVFTDNLKTAFYDALHFVSPRLAYAFSDSDADAKLQLATYTQAKGWQKLKSNIHLKKGEAAFAASNSNIVSKGRWVWIVTGGEASRILRLNRRSDKIEIFEPPFIQGSPSSGMYAIDFYNSRFGIAVGGDYTKPSGNINNIAVTKDGGKTWQIKASGKNAGYSTTVRFRPGSGGREIVALGDGHISMSKDFGESWTQISAEKNLYAAEFTDRNTLIAAGKDRILKFTFNEN